MLLNLLISADISKSWTASINGIRGGSTEAEYQIMEMDFNGAK